MSVNKIQIEEYIDKAYVPKPEKVEVWLDKKEYFWFAIVEQSNTKWLLQISAEAEEIDLDELQEICLAESVISKILEGED